MNLQAQLQPTSILRVPLNTYSNDFTFIVNNKEFRTSRLFSDLISPKISEYHANDPTMKEFIINTKNRGDFSIVMALNSFSSISVPSSDIPFFCEIFEILGNDSINIIKKSPNVEINASNVISLLLEHCEFQYFYQQEIEKEISFISSNFYELCEKQRDSLKNLDQSLIEKIISNSQLKLNDEGQLLSFINDVYEISHETSNLYSYVIFNNVDHSNIHSFVSLFDYNDLTRETWISLCQRLESEEIQVDSSRYIEKKVKNNEKSNFSTFSPQGQNDFNGIINFLRKSVNNKIESKVNITTSSFRGSYPPSRTVEYENPNGEFCTEDKPDCWICFEFRENQVSLTHYQIRSTHYSKGYCHPRNWVIEGSMDNVKWDNLDTQTNCSYLNENNVSHVFDISNQTSKKYRYIRMKQTGVNWNSNNFFSMNAIEFYGKLF